MTIHTSFYMLPTNAAGVITQVKDNVVTIHYSIPSDINEEAREAIKEWSSQPENASKILEMMAKSGKD